MKIVQLVLGKFLFVQKVEFRENVQIDRESIKQHDKTRVTNDYFPILLIKIFHVLARTDKRRVGIFNKTFI